MLTKRDLKKISDYLWEIPKGFRPDMKVPARIYVSEKMMDLIFRDKSLNQLINVTSLPGIQKYALAMPDIHEGYGFPIGGVGATKLPDGVISPGGVGFDINCGVRLLKSELLAEDIQAHLEKLAYHIQQEVPHGVGRGGRIRLDETAINRVLKQGAARVVAQGYGTKEDLDHCEEEGQMKEADPSAVSYRAKMRGRDQLGTLGAGNHFLEVQEIIEIFDEAAAEVFGLFKDQVCVAIHSGSRGLGHQIATDYIRQMMQVMVKYKVKLADPELAAAPFNSSEGQQYFKAMCCGANYAWANRQIMTYLVRQAWQSVLGKTGSQLKLLYDVAHNIAKIEEYSGDRRDRSRPVPTMKLCVHRKGATRALGPDNPALPQDYQKVGQPVLIPGSMGTASYILVGTKKAEQETFGSVCHGAGRVMSRHQALRQVGGEKLKADLEKKGIIVRGSSWRGLAEEAPLAYKDVDDVVNVVAGAGLANKVAKLKPLAVIKG